MAGNRAGRSVVNNVTGPQSVSSAWARQQIATMFRELRQSAGYTQEDVARYLYRHVGSYGNLERADPKVSIHPDRDVRRMVEFCKADNQTLERLLQLAAATKEDGPFTQYRDVMSAEFGTYTDMQQSAESICCYVPDLVPGLFQTEAYAHQVLSLPGIDGRVRHADEVRARVALRLQRQEILMRVKRPLKMVAILSEGVLRSPVGGQEIMAEQLCRIVDLSRRRNVTVRVVPLQAGLHLGMTTGSFDVLRFPDNTMTPIVYADGFLGDSYFKGPAEVRIYDAAFADIAKHALNIKESRMFIENIAKELSARD